MKEKAAIGKKLQGLRKMKGVTLTKLSEETGMGYSYLSNLENDKHSITISNLQRLAEYFDVDLIYFLLDDNEDDVVFIGKNDRKSIETDDGVSFKVLTPGNAGNLQVSLINIPANAPEERRIHSHDDGEEYIYVLEGVLYVMIRNQKYKLEAGDSVFFNSSIEHVIFTEKESASFFLIVSPPYGQEDF